MSKSLSAKIKSYFLRHLQMMLFSLGRLWRQPVSSLMTVAVIGIALALPAGLFVLMQNVHHVSDDWESGGQISLFLKEDLSEQQGQAVSEDIAEWPNVKQVHYQSAEQSLEEFRTLSGLGDLVDSLPDNPLPAVITLYPGDDATTTDAVETLLSSLNALPEVDQAQLDMAWLQRLRSINQLIERGIILLGLILSLSVLLVIGNTIRLAILNRQSEIKVMKLVGATDRFIRRPFLYTGFWYGFLGGLFAWATLLLAMNLLSEPVQTLAAHYGSEYQLQWFAGFLLLYLPLAGLLLGVIGAWIAVSRHLHAIEPN